jgi:hypothetical protein
MSAVSLNKTHADSRITEMKTTENEAKSEILQRMLDIRLDELEHAGNLAMNRKTSALNLVAEIEEYLGKSIAINQHVLVPLETPAPLLINPNHLSHPSERLPPLPLPSCPWSSDVLADTIIQANSRAEKTKRDSLRDLKRNMDKVFLADFHTNVCSTATDNQRLLK